MATNTSNTVETLLINLDGEMHSLIVTVRNDNQGLSQSQLSDLTGATIKAWMQAYRAVKEDSPAIYLEKTPCEKLEIEPSKAEPYVTVWNRAHHALTLTVHSNDNGGGAVKCAKAYHDAIAKFQAVAPQYFNMDAVQPKSKSEAEQVAKAKTIEPDFSQSPNSAISKPYVRETANAPFSNSISLVRKKGDNVTAILATKPYDYQAEIETDVTVVYELLGNFSVITHSDGTKAIALPVKQGGAIHIRYSEDKQWENKTIKSDWSNLVNHLGYKDCDHLLVEGYSGQIEAKYIAMKFKADGNWKNYYGLFASLPQKQQAG